MWKYSVLCISLFLCGADYYEFLVVDVDFTVLRLEHFALFKI